LTASLSFVANIAADLVVCSAELTTDEVRAEVPDDV